MFDNKKETPKRKYSFFYSEDISTVPINCGRMQCPPNHSYGPHIRNYFLIHYVFSGRGYFYAGGKEYEVNPDWCFIIHPGEITTYKADYHNPWDYGWLGFSCTPSPSFLSQHTAYVPQMRTIFERIRKDHIDYGKQWYLLILIGKLLSELSSIDNPGNDNSQKKQMLKMKAEIDNQYASPISITEQAKQCNMERSHYSRTFKKYVGYSPKEYQCQVRMDNASSLLRTTTLSIGDIAIMVGFPEVTAFSKAFHKEYKTSPSEYRKKAKQRDESNKYT